MTSPPRIQEWVGGRVVTPEGVLAPGWLHAADGRIVGVGAGEHPVLAADGEAERYDLAGAWLLPGFVDLHMHGGGGHDVNDSPTELLQAVAFHARHGTTSTLVSLVTAPVEELVRQLEWIADLSGAGSGSHARVLGAHLEGPFLSPHRCGAQNISHMRAPDRDLFASLLAAADGTLRTITLAPELPGALDILQDAVSAGVVAALGHSDATYAAASAAIDAGASLATHLFNGMRPLHHREPGLIGAALASGIAVELINDGIHVHPAITSLVACPAGRLALVTDAISAAGVGDGDYALGGQAVRVRDGRARLTSTGSLAGSTLTMDEAVRRAVQHSGMSVEGASAAASSTPARVLGVANKVGALSPGLAADLVVLDDELRVLDVVIAGRPLRPAEVDGRVTSAYRESRLV